MRLPHGDNKSHGNNEPGAKECSFLFTGGNTQAAITMRFAQAPRKRATRCMHAPTHEEPAHLLRPVLVGPARRFRSARSLLVLVSDASPRFAPCYLSDGRQGTDDAVVGEGQAKSSFFRCRYKSRARCAR